MPYYAGTMTPTIADFAILAYITSYFTNPMSMTYDGDHELLS